MTVIVVYGNRGGCDVTTTISHFQCYTDNRQPIWFGSSNDENMIPAEQKNPRNRRKQDNGRKRSFRWLFFVFQLAWPGMAWPGSARKKEQRNGSSHTDTMTLPLMLPSPRLASHTATCMTRPTPRDSQIAASGRAHSSRRWIQWKCHLPVLVSFVSPSGAGQPEALRRRPKTSGHFSL